MPSVKKTTVMRDFIVYDVDYVMYPAVQGTWDSPLEEANVEILDICLCGDSVIKEVSDDIFLDILTTVMGDEGIEL